MKRGYGLSGFICLLLLFGCASHHYEYSQLKPPVSNKYYNAEIRLVAAPGSFPVYYNALALKLKNKTNKPIKILWDQTKYLYYDKENGGFMQEKVKCNKRHEVVPPEVVPPYTTITQKLYPVNLVIISSNSEEVATFKNDEELDANYECQHEAFKVGENGILLTVQVGNEIIHDEISHNLQLIQYHQSSDGY